MIKLFQNLFWVTPSAGLVSFSLAHPTGPVKFKRLCWQTMRFLALALGFSLLLMDYRFEWDCLNMTLKCFHTNI